MELKNRDNAIATLQAGNSRGNLPAQSVILHNTLEHDLNGHEVSSDDVTL